MLGSMCTDSREGNPALLPPLRPFPPNQAQAPLSFSFSIFVKSYFMHFASTHHTPSTTPSPNTQYQHPIANHNTSSNSRASRAPAFVLYRSSFSFSFPSLSFSIHFLYPFYPTTTNCIRLGWHPDQSHPHPSPSPAAPYFDLSLASRPGWARFYLREKEGTGSGSNRLFFFFSLLSVYSLCTPRVLLAIQIHPRTHAPTPTHTPE